MKIDHKSGIIITWSQGSKGGGQQKGQSRMGGQASICFNYLNAGPPSAKGSGAKSEEEIDEAKISKAKDALRKLIESQKLSDGIVEGTAEVMRCVEEKNILMCVLAADAEPKFKKSFMAKAKACNAQFIEVGSRDELGTWLGHCKFDRHKRPVKITPVPLFALKDYGAEFDSYSVLKGFMKDQNLQRQNRTGNLIALMKEIIDYEEQILDVLVFLEYRYFLVATDEGNIYVYKYVQTGKVETQKRLIHTYEGHSKHVTNMMQIKNFPHLFLSASLDGTARVWSLDTFQHLYTIDIPGTLVFCQILSRSDYIISQSHDYLQVHRLHMILENYMNSESQIKSIEPGFYTADQREAGVVDFTVSTCLDNSAFIKSIAGEAAHDKTTLYPPPSAQTIKKIVYSSKLDRLILLLSSSTICIYKQVKETALLEKILDPSEVKDCEQKRAFSQQVTCMELVTTRSRDEFLPFDTEVLNLRMHESTLEDALADTGAQKEFVVLGLSKGTVLLFHVAQLTQLYCRFTVHRDKIKIIRYLPNTRTFVTVCKEGNFKFWQIAEDRKVNVLLSFKMAEKKICKVHLVAPGYFRHDAAYPSDRILVVFATGESELYDFQKGSPVLTPEGETCDSNLYLVENEKQKEHDSKVSGVDSNRFARLIVTADVSGYVRLWSLDKRFMREI